MEMPRLVSSRLRSLDLRDGSRGRASSSSQSDYAMLPTELSSHVNRALDLDTMEIRLLVVEAGRADQPVQCTIQHTALWPKPSVSYETLSYVWGDTTARGVVFCGQHQLDVPLSAEKVLRRMRHLDKPRTLWIDAICINQSDIQERSQQVGIMADIYFHTSQNLIWLGDSGEDPELDIAAVNAVCEDARKESRDFRDLDRSPEGEFSASSIQTEFVPEAVLRVFASTWFSRLWGRSYIRGFISLKVLVSSIMMLSRTPCEPSLPRPYCGCLHHGFDLLACLREQNTRRLNGPHVLR